MIKNILIVTWNQDWHQCSNMLIPSISKFIPGANIKIVDTTFHTPSPIIAPSFSNITYEVLPAIQLLETLEPWKGDNHNEGWMYQQMCKLAGYKLFDSEFVVLDSELVILRKFDKWPTYCRLTASNTHFNKFIEYASARLNIDCEGHCFLEPCVPYILDPKILKEIVSTFGSFAELYKWFSTHSEPSEFILYDLFKYRKDLQQDINNQNIHESPVIQFIIDNKPYVLDSRYDFALINRDTYRNFGK